MIAGIITNERKDAGLVYTREVCAFLTARKVTPCTGMVQDADFWVVLGGDGTMLRAAHSAALQNMPMIGINLGRVGFLTDVGKHEGFLSLEKVIRGEFLEEKRMMLLVGDNPSSESLPNHLALNEAYLSSEKAGKLMNFTLYINEQRIDDIRADGIIVATPTGSTAYSLSAGGPILMPSGEMIVITAVNPQRLGVRPWVISAHDTVRVVPDREIPVSLDGDINFFSGNGVVIRRAPHMVTILKTSPTHFFEVLRGV